MYIDRHLKNGIIQSLKARVLPYSGISVEGFIETKF